MYIVMCIRMCYFGKTFQADSISYILKRICIFMIFNATCVHIVCLPMCTIIYVLLAFKQRFTQKKIVFCRVFKTHFLSNKKRICFCFRLPHCRHWYFVGDRIVWKNWLNVQWHIAAKMWINNNNENQCNNIAMSTSSNNCFWQTYFTAHAWMKCERIRNIN